MDFSSFFSLLQSIIMLLLVIVLAGFSLRFLNKYMTKHNKMIKVIERVTLSNNSSLSIVDICGDYYLMSFTANDNKILKKLDREEVKNIIKANPTGDEIKLLDMGKKINNFLRMEEKIE